MSTLIPGDGGLELLARLVACYLMWTEEGGVYHSGRFDSNTQAVKNNAALFPPIIAAGLHHHLQLVPPSPERVLPDPPAEMEHAGLVTVCETILKVRQLRCKNSNTVS
jgi:hypothetical protein